MRLVRVLCPRGYVSGGSCLCNTCVTGLCVPIFGLVSVSGIFIWPSYLEQASAGLFVALASPFGLGLLQRILSLV